MTDFDLCVIGGGPAGYAAAVRAWDYGKRVCLVEKDKLGGAGVHHGALSSKTYWELSRDYLNAQRLDRGYRAEALTVDFAQVTDCVRLAVEEKTRQLQTQLRALSTPDEAHGGSITLLEGAARFVDSARIEIDDLDGKPVQSLTVANFIVATGSRPRTLAGVPVDGTHILTSDQIDDIGHFPRSLVIIGAGVIGCEFATIFANFGQTKVYLIDRADRILPFEDEDISRMCSANLEARGVTIHHGSNLKDLRVVDDHVEYTIEYYDGGRETIAVEQALVSIGREPETDALGLDKAGVECDARGHVNVDDTRTSVPHIYATGDTTFDVALANVAEVEGRHAVDRIFGGRVEPMDYDNLATIMFLDPEVAAVGMNELAAKRERIPYRVAVYSYALVNRAIAMRATDGFIKLLVSDNDTMRILGVRALGVHASTTIDAVSLMIHHGRSATDLAELIHPHPAITEGLQDCVRMLLGTSTFKPHVFGGQLRLSRASFND